MAAHGSALASRTGGEAQPRRPRSAKPLAAVVDADSWMARAKVRLRRWSSRWSDRERDLAGDTAGFEQFVGLGGLGQTQGRLEVHAQFPRLGQVG